MMTGVLAVIGIFFVPVVMIILIVLFKTNERIKRNQLQADLFTKALEKGQSVPANLFAEPRKRGNPLKTGLICMAAGIGSALCIWMASIQIVQLSEEASVVFFAFSSVGIIPFLIGIAFVIIHFMEKKKDTEEDAK